MDKKEKTDKIKYILDFLQLKQDLLDQRGLKDKDAYITEVDKKIISTWKDKHLIYVYEGLMCDVCSDDLLSAFKSCPFCIYMSIQKDIKCESCDYGKSHGICSNSESTYQIYISPVFQSGGIKLLANITSNSEFLAFRQASIKKADKLGLFNEVLESELE